LKLAEAALDGAALLAAPGIEASGRPLACPRGAAVLSSEAGPPFRLGQAAGEFGEFTDVTGADQLTSGRVTRGGGIAR